MLEASDIQANMGTYKQRFSASNFFIASTWAPITKAGQVHGQVRKVTADSKGEDKNTYKKQTQKLLNDSRLGP